MKRAVVKIGGSLLITENGIDTTFLSQLHAFFIQQAEIGGLFFFVIGGGKTTRTYQKAAQLIDPHITKEELDWIGIHSTRLNAQLLHTIFLPHAIPRIIENYDHKLENVPDHGIVVASGWKPGHSTNACAVKLAIDYNVDTIINLTNTPYVYDKDPRTNLDAQPFTSLTWDTYFSIVPNEWTPGANLPFDHVAAHMAQKHNKKVIITDGHNLQNVAAILADSEADGTVIS